VRESPAASPRPSGLTTRLKDAALFVCLTALLLGTLEILARVYYHLRPEREDAAAERAFGSRKDSAWTGEYMREFAESGKMSWHPYVYWRRDAFAGKYINVDSSGVRRTVNTRPGGHDSLRLFVFGGSAVWGPWIRDAQTIPSCLSRALNDGAHRRVEVTNFGESGFVSTQEVIQLMLELRKGNVPDEVVFYDGVNDVFSAFQNGEPGIPLNESNRVRSFQGEPLSEWVTSHSELLTGLTRLRAKLSAGRPSITAAPSGAAGPGADLEQLAERTLRVYEENARMVEALGREYGFETFFIWQPALFSKERLSPAEASYRESFDAGLAQFFRSVYAIAPRAGAHLAHFADFQGIFNGRDETVFIDYCHVKEQWDALIADAICQTLYRSSARVTKGGGDRVAHTGGIDDYPQ